MSYNRVRSTALDEAACATLHAATLTVLEQTGVEVGHERALEQLAAAGASVDGTRVRMPRALIEQALSTAPKTVVVESRGAAPSLSLRAGEVFFGTGSDCLSIIGPDAHDRRPVTLDDVEEMAALQERLPNMDFVMSMAHPKELPPTHADAAQLAAMLRGTSKPILMVPPDGAGLHLLKEMAAACGAAGSLAVYAMPTPPLVHGYESTDRLVRCAELGIPMIYATALLPGATAPASRAGFLVQGNAEMLSGLVIAQVAQPGAPYVYGVAQGSMNLRTAHVLYCAPEEHAIQQGSADLAAYYDLPSFGYAGCSDSLILDEQWALEAGMSLLAAAASGVTLVHDLGYLASGTASSYEAVVLMDELVAYVKSYLEGVTIDDEMLAVEEIAAVGPGGTHLARKYTRRHYRDFYVPSLLSQQAYDDGAAGGTSSLLQRTAERTRDLRSRERAYAPSPEATAELDRLIEETRVLRESS